MPINHLFESHQLADEWVHAFEWRETSVHNIGMWTEHHRSSEKRLRDAEGALVAYLRSPDKPDQVHYFDPLGRLHTLTLTEDGAIRRTLSENVKPPALAVLESFGLGRLTPARQIEALAEIVRRYQSGELVPANVDDFNPVNHFHLTDEEPDSDG